MDPASISGLKIMKTNLKINLEKNADIISMKLQRWKHVKTYQEVLVGSVLDLWHIGANPDPQIKSFFAYFFLKVHLHHSSKIKSYKEVTKWKNTRNQGFLLFCLMMEGSGSVPLTNGFESRMPKNLGSGTLLEGILKIFLLAKMCNR